MPEPSGSTGAQPSAEAIDVAARQRKMSRMDDTASILAAAYAIDAPAIHAAGVQEGRAAMLREVVAFVRDHGERMARAIEAGFSSEGTT